MSAPTIRFLIWFPSSGLGTRSRKPQLPVTWQSKPQLAFPHSQAGAWERVRTLLSEKGEETMRFHLFRDGIVNA
ncbi:MAG: hypothetical protein B6245_18995 [Desulfobacteraceae bacterium 4572_88]|nr:MAG: hypothetical protein B6245_18995 [Desulfobacteraceae bacterium 4572_88]